MPARALLVALALAALPGAAVRAASIIPVATLLEPAAGGGVYAGPGFLGTPAAAGSGWVAFRSLIAPRGSVEELVLANMDPSTSTRISVARTGQEVDAVLGTIGRFLGHPAVDATGHVVFMATLSPPTAPPPGVPTPAAVLRFDPGTRVMTPLATSGTATAVGALALAEGPSGSTPTLDERTPAIGPDGSIAFAGLGVGGDVERPAVFLLRDGLLAVVAAAGDPVPGGSIAAVGPPAIGAPGHVALRATLAGAQPAEAVLLWREGAVTQIAGTGDTVTTTEPTVATQTLTTFGPVLDLAPDDTVAFLGGPLADLTTGSTASGFGVLAWRGGDLELLAFPGQRFGARGRITGVSLVGEFAGTIVPPRILPDGAVFFHAELNAGSSSALARVAAAGEEPVELAVAGGGAPTATPIGGTLAAFTSPPTVDDTGAIVAVAAIDGGPTSHALFRGLAAPPSQAIVVGEPSPGQNGLLAGPPFSEPHVTGTGDVLFVSTLAAGPSPIGLFRWRGGQAVPVVRAGDAAPVPGALPFTNIVGQYDVNDAGAVVFAAFVSGLGRGIYATDAGGLRRVAAAGDTVRLTAGTVATFDTLLPNPAIAADGTIAFRARVIFDDEGVQRRRAGIFLDSAGQLRAVVLEDDPAGPTKTFDLFREVAVASGGTIAFVADVTDATATRRALFVADRDGMRPVLTEGDRLDEPVTGFVGGPALNDGGVVTQLVRVAGPDGDRATVVRGTPTHLGVLAQVGAESPAGGTYRSLGRPAMNGNGDVAFRATFEAGTGGVPGLLLATETTVQTVVAIGDPGPASVQGQFVSVGQRVSVNDDRTIAFLGALAGGTVRDGVFLAEPATLTLPRLRLRIGSETKPDRLNLKFRLTSASATRTLDLATSRVRLTVQDGAGAAWTETVAPGQLVRRRRAFVYSRQPIVSKIKVTISGNGTVRGVARAHPDLSNGGLFPITPPLTVELQIGDVSGRTVVNCLTSRRRVRCR